MKTPNSKAVLILASCLAAYALAGLAARSYWGPDVNRLIITALIAIAVPLAAVILWSGIRGDGSKQRGDHGELAEQLLQAISPMVLATSLDGTFTYLNPSAERILGMRGAELIGQSKMLELFAPGEMDRISQWLRKLNANVVTPDVQVAATDPMHDCVNYVLNFPPSQLRGIDLQLKRGDGSTFPAMLYLSAIRSADGKPNGLLAVALDQTLSARQERALRESRERYRDLFENANEMIATLNPAGQFVYVNPVWKSCFGLADGDFNKLESLEMVFSPDCRSEVGRLFKLALEGETVEREPVRTHTIDGRVLDLELSLSRRQKTDNPLAIRCMLRDITPQKQRERRLALQLVVSQIIGQSASPELASMRILESVCLSQGWDAAILWTLNDEEERLKFYSAWGAPGKRGEALIQESMGQSIVSGPDLPGRVWQQGRAVWIEELASALGSTPRSPRIAGRSAPWTGHGLGGSGTRRQSCDGGAGVLQSSEPTRRPRDDGDAGDGLLVAGADAGSFARAGQRRRAAPHPADSAGYHRRRHLWRRSQWRREPGKSGGRTAAGCIARRTDRYLGPRTAARSRAWRQRVRRRLCPVTRTGTRTVLPPAETTVYKRDGRSFPAEFSLTPILEQGRVSGSVLSFRDISQRFALDRMKDEFVSTVSHELRTPLTSIRGALGLLSAGLLGNIERQGRQPAAHRAHELGPAGAADQRHSRSGAHSKRARAALVPPGCSWLRSFARRSTACSRWPMRRVYS